MQARTNWFRLQLVWPRVRTVEFTSQRDWWNVQQASPETSGYTPLNMHLKGMRVDVYNLFR
jgi:hypothetical protein